MFCCGVCFCGVIDVDLEVVWIGDVVFFLWLVE